MPHRLRYWHGVPPGDLKAYAKRVGWKLLHAISGAVLLIALVYLIIHMVEK